MMPDIQPGLALRPKTGKKRKKKGSGSLVPEPFLYKMYTYIRYIQRYIDICINPKPLNPRNPILQFCLGFGSGLQVTKLVMGT